MKMPILNQAQLKMVKAIDELGGGPLRHDPLRRKLGYKTPSCLSHNLCVLERHGLIEPRLPFQPITLSLKGKEFAKAIEKFTAAQAA